MTDWDDANSRHRGLMGKLRSGILNRLDSGAFFVYNIEERDDLFGEEIVVTIRARKRQVADQ